MQTTGCLFDGLFDAKMARDSYLRYRPPTARALLAVNSCCYRFTMAQALLDVNVSKIKRTEVQLQVEEIRDISTAYQRCLEVCGTQGPEVNYGCWGRMCAWMI